MDAPFEEMFLGDNIQTSDENKNYKGIVNIGTLQSSTCLKVQKDSKDFFGFYPEL